jgi:hypothetical protein
MVIRNPKSDRFMEIWTVQVLVSRDGGASWTRRTLPRPDGTLSDDPWLAWAEDGTVLAVVPCQAGGCRWRRNALEQLRAYFLEEGTADCWDVCAAGDRATAA